MLVTSSDDADGEMVLGLLLVKVCIHGVNHGRREFLAAEAVTSANDFDVLVSGFHKRVEHILIERFAEGAGLLGAIQHREALDGLGQGVHKLGKPRMDDRGAP